MYGPPVIAGLVIFKEVSVSKSPGPGDLSILLGLFSPMVNPVLGFLLKLDRKLLSYYPGPKLDGESFEYLLSVNYVLSIYSFMIFTDFELYMTDFSA